MLSSAALRSTLVQVAAAMAPARHDWWIVASAAVALHGADPGEVRDVDVLFDPRDAERVLGPLNLAPQPGRGDAQFRSDLFVTWDAPPLPVEFFAGFQLCEAGQWSPVRLKTRQPIDVDGAQLWIPERAELQALLLRFGRDKDRVRAALLSPSGPSPSRSESV